MRLVGNSLDDSMTFWDYVSEEISRRMGYPGDPAFIFIEHGMEKQSTETAVEVAWQYAEEGAALGATYPDVFRSMFERTHALAPKEQWARARAAGLNLPVEQEVMSYDEIEQDENGVFIAYCEKCYPQLYEILPG
jgi:hypothetical protein